MSSIGEIQYKDKPDISYVWLKHMDRVNMMSGEEAGSYNAYVRQQFRLLPTNMQQWVLTQADSYKKKEKTFIYKKILGRKIGSEEKPVTTDKSIPLRRFGDGTINWSDPNIYSPTRKEVEVVDYEIFNSLILAAAEKAGLSWNIKNHTYDNGDVTPEMKSKKKLRRHPISKTPTGKPYSDTPAGENMNIISEIKNTGISIVDWHGTQILQGIGYSPIFFDLVQERTNKENGTIIGIGGAPSDGKTYSGIRLGEILCRVFNRTFNPYTQIPFTQEHFLWLLSEDTPLTLGDVIVLDEAHFAAGARNWFKEDQKELVDLIASARNMGFIIILIVLHLDMLDKILRQFTMAFYLHMESPGHATAYRTITPRFSSDMIKITIGPVTLQLPDVGKCDHPRCLRCKSLETCLTTRGIYERRKTEFQQGKVESSRDRRMEHKNKEKEYANHETTIKFAEDNKNKIPETQGEITSWINDSGLKVKARDIAAWSKEILKLRKP